MGTQRQDASGRTELARRQYMAGLLNRRIAANVENLNEIFTVAGGEPGDVTLLCACGREDCDRPTVTLPLDDYNRLVRRASHRFLIAVGHAAEIDEVIYSCPDFEVVEIKPEHRLDEPL